MNAFFRRPKPGPNRSRSASPVASVKSQGSNAANARRPSNSSNDGSSKSNGGIKSSGGAKSSTGYTGTGYTGTGGGGFYRNEEEREARKLLAKENVARGTEERAEFRRNNPSTVRAPRMPSARARNEKIQAEKAEEEARMAKVASEKRLSMDDLFNDSDNLFGGSDVSSSSSSSRGVKRERPEEDEADEENMKPRKAPKSPPASAPLPERTSTTSKDSKKGDDLFPKPRTVKYGSHRRGLLVAKDRKPTGSAAAAGSAATIREERKDIKKETKVKDEDEDEVQAVTPKFKAPPPLSPEPDLMPQKKFRLPKGTADVKKKEEENKEPQATFKTKFLEGAGKDATDEDTPPRPTFKWPISDESGSHIKTSSKTTKSKARSPSPSLSPSPSPPTKAAKAKAKELLEARRKKKMQDTRERRLQLQKGKTGAAALFDELDVESRAGKRETSPESRPVFKMPASYDGRPASSSPADAALEEKDSKRSLDDLFLEISDEDSDGSDSTVPLVRPPATCPVCKEAVNDEAVRVLLVTLYPNNRDVAAAVATASTTNKGGRKSRRRTEPTAADLLRRHLLRFDDKLRFCEGHRQRASKAAWVARGYPAIDWDALNGRLKRHYGHVRRILEDETPSMFREALENDNRKKNDDSHSAAVTPGYYGQKGLRVLTEAIVLEFSGLLRKRAVADRLIAARGSSQFVEAVLVPELAVQLIREDMGVGATEAQRILRESGTIGEDVHGEVRDVVEEEDDDVDDESTW